MDCRCVLRPAIAGILVLTGLAGGSPSAAQDMTLEVPAEVLVGAPIEITWSGPEGRTGLHQHR